MGKQSRDRLRKLRKLLDLSQEELGQAAGVTRQSIQLIEAGKQAVSPERMAPINALLRTKRHERVAYLQTQIQLLQSFDIDETLYLKGVEN